MRLWSLHPKYLDRKGLTAAWREALLAQKVLMGETRGYRNHPQLDRFKRQDDPFAAIGSFLYGLLEESLRRDYRFDGEKIQSPKTAALIPVTLGQILFERNHLLEKLQRRDFISFQRLMKIRDPEPHPLFRIVEGEVEEWERTIQ